MSLTRKCDACTTTIERDTVVELTARVLKVNEGEHQDAVEERYGEYCDACLLDGAALRDVLGALNKHTIPLPTART